MKDASGGPRSSLTTTKAGGLAIGAAAAIAYWQHYRENVAVPPQLWIADGPLRECVLPHCRALLRPFAPTPWAANRHAQTVLGFLRTHTIRNHYTRQHILTVDGATLGLDWFADCDGPSFPGPPSAPILLVCHGINGGSHEGYAKWVCAEALSRSWRAVVLNYRGCNGLPFTAPRGYAASMSHDVFTAVYSIKARFPSAPLLAVGYSLGGLKLTKYLAEADAGLHFPPQQAPRLFSGSGLVAAAVVSSPVCLSRSAAKLSDVGSLSFGYNLAVAYKIREHIARHSADIRAHSSFDPDTALSCWTLTQMEDRGLTTSFGFSDRQDYYDTASCPREHIPAITTPTLLLLAEDDPFLGLVPKAECSRNPSTLLALTRRGGHVAFLQGAWPLGRTYMDEAVTEFFAATMEHLHGCDPRDGRPGTGVGTGGDQHAVAAVATADSAAATGAGVGVERASMKCDGGGVEVSDAMRAGVLAAAAAAVRQSCSSCCSHAAVGLTSSSSGTCCGGGVHHHHHQETHHHHNNHHHQGSQNQHQQHHRQAANVHAGRGRDDAAQEVQRRMLLGLQRELQHHRAASASPAGAGAAGTGVGGAVATSAAHTSTVGSASRVQRAKL